MRSRIADRTWRLLGGDRHVHPGGFTLVISIMLMVLLVILAVGMLALSSISLRSSKGGADVAEARANARLALMLAIGELQRELGPDQRVSARAGILDTTPATVEADDVANPHYLGIWDSWDTWLTDKKGPLSIQDTYRRGRDSSLFRSWLVSNPKAWELETALNAVPENATIKLCGPGAAGNNPLNQVKVGRVQLRSDTLTTGSYAWWVSDESQKARLDLRAREDAGAIEKAQIVASHTGRAGIETMVGMGGFDTSPESLDKMITTGEASLSAAAAPEHSHDLTAYSLGLLTDVRSGGFKGDLNLAFESETVLREMDEAKIFGGRPFDAPIRPLTGELAKIVPQNPYVAPLSWRQLREYVDPTDKAETKRHQPGKTPNETIGLKPVNQTFGRSFRLVSFRWLAGTEI